MELNHSGSYLTERVIRFHPPIAVRGFVTYCPCLSCTTSTMMSASRRTVVTAHIIAFVKAQPGKMEPIISREVAIRHHTFVINLAV